LSAISEKFNPVGNYAVYLGFLAVFLILMFLVSLFKNISYPLLWADESMTAVHGERVLEYGYPKVHDGKNIVYDLRHPNPKLGIDEKTDAYIGGANWGQYYFAAPGVKLAARSQDLYTKTAILRIPFALAGLAGLSILALLAAHFFDGKSSQRGFLVLFAFLELISVPLVLHLREVRYYSLTFFLLALTLLSYTRYNILNKGGYALYAALLTVSLFLLYVTFSPVYFICLVAIFLFESIAVVTSFLARKRKNYRPTDLFAAISFNKSFTRYLLGVLPLILSLLAIAPLVSFFKTFYIAAEMAKYNNLLFGISGWNMYLENLSVIWKYFASSDLILLAIFLKVCLLFSIRRFSRRDLPSVDIGKLMFSNFLTVLFLVYFFAIARIPNFAFTRYFIPLQPILAVIIILDAALTYNLIARQRFPGLHYGKALLLVASAGFIVANISHNMEYIKGHVYELFHQYKGPLDYLIPFINKTYPDTDELVIATNYEETSFMYYLHSKVIIGYVGNNLEQDMRMTPDVVIFREGWRNLDPNIFINFLKRNRYQQISFPIFDYDFNNVPELNFSPACEHQFRTLDTDNESMKINIFLKKMS
jgi:hypothetical protein